MNISRLDRATGIINTINLAITPKQLLDIKAGHKINNVVPHLTQDQRDFIETGFLAESLKDMVIK